MKDFLPQPDTAKTTISELKDLLTFYLATTDYTTADCSTTGTQTGSRIADVIEGVETDQGLPLI